MDFNEFIMRIRPNGVSNTPLNAIRRTKAFAKAAGETLEALMNMRQKGFANKMRAGIEFWDKSYKLNQQALNVAMSVNEAGSANIETSSGVRSDSYNGVDLETGARLSIKTLMQGNRVLHVPIKMIVGPSPVAIAKDRYYTIMDKYAGDRGVSRAFKELERELSRSR